MKKNEYIIRIPESNHYVLHLKLKQHFKSTILQKQTKKPPNGIRFLSLEQRNLERLTTASVGRMWRKQKTHLSICSDNVKWYSSRRQFESYGKLSHKDLPLSCELSGDLRMYKPITVPAPYSWLCQLSTCGNFCGTYEQVGLTNCVLARELIHA